MPDARRAAAEAARVLRAALVDPDAAGERSTLHIDFSRRRSAWYFTWANLPGLMMNTANRTYSHRLLPGWEYTVAEMKAEMIEDLERLAETGEQPKEATR